jgi:hypothetical protein
MRMHARTRKWGRDCGGTCHNDCQKQPSFYCHDDCVFCWNIFPTHYSEGSPKMYQHKQRTICSTEAERSPYLPTMVLYRGLPGIQHRKGSVSPGTTACRRLDWDRARCALLTRTSYIILEYREALPAEQHYWRMTTVRTYASREPRSKSRSECYYYYYYYYV